MSKNESWHLARGNASVASTHHTGAIAHPGPMRGRFHRSPLPAGRGTVNTDLHSGLSATGLQGIGPAAYHFQHHHPVYPSERRQQTCCHHSHYPAADLRMQTLGRSTLLSFLYQSERRLRR